MFLFFFYRKRLDFHLKCCCHYNSEKSAFLLSVYTVSLEDIIGKVN